MLYVKIQELHKRKLKVIQITQELKVSRPTIYKYVETTLEAEQPHQRRRV